MSIDFQTALSSPTGAYAEGLRFFAGKGMINDALKRLAADLDRNNIEYAVIGAVALNQHGYRRFTEDIDLLLTRDRLEKFKNVLIGLGYRPAISGAKNKFRTTDENIPVDVITSGEFPGDGLPKAVVFPDPAGSSVMIDGVNTIVLEKLVELKLASGMTAGDRLKDLADVQELIKIKHLGVKFTAKLHSSVRVKFVELLDAVTSAKSDRDEQ